jgi:HPt (histidine-containing phosphotransfer) domain-containing protein
VTREVLKAATMGSPGCTSSQSRLQPYVIQEAHKLKGSSSIIAARLLPSLANQLQQAARADGEVSVEGCRVGVLAIVSGKLPPHLLEYTLQGEDVPRLVGQIRQQFGLLERDIALRLKLREAQPQEAASDTDVDRIMGGNLPLLVRHARAFGLRRLVSSLSTHGVEVAAAGEEGGGKGGGETMSSMRLSVLVPRYLSPVSRYLSPPGVDCALLPTHYWRNRVF